MVTNRGRRRRRIGWALGVAVVLVALAASAAARLAPLDVFNAIVPKDPGSARIAAGIRYGDAARQELDIYAPIGPEAPSGVLVFFYGGSWTSGARGSYAFVGRALAAQGFVVVVPDYRLVPDHPYPDFLKDCALAVRWTAANIGRFGGDGRRIVLVGHSAGAYNAAMLALDPARLGPDRAAIRGFVGLSGPYDFLPFDSPVAKAAFGHWPRPEETQPIVHASDDDPPALLLHGDGDETVRPANSVRLAERLHALGGSAVLTLLPGESHAGLLLAVSRPLRGRAPVLSKMAAFARSVLARPEQPGEGSSAPRQHSDSDL